MPAKYSSQIKKLVVKAVWWSLWLSLKGKWWWTPVLICLLSIVGLFTVNQQSAGTTNLILGATPDFWRGVAGSCLAAGLIAIIQQITILAEKAENQIEGDFTNKFLEAGLIQTFQQRGDDTVRQMYRTKIETAQTRIWAFGMTNQAMCQDHTERILEAAQKHSLNVVFAFWDPDTRMKLPCGASHSLSDIQTMLEKGVSTESGTHSEIHHRQQNLVSKINGVKKKLKGSATLDSCKSQVFQNPQV
jgi:hypothetical protein